jgi:hypothetical protein
MSVEAGTALIAASGLVAGSPWLGSNAGAAITLLAAAGLWFGIRTDRSWWGTALIAAATTATGIALVALAHRFLPGGPTHISALVEDGSGVAGIAGSAIDRLRIGLDLLVDSPFALIPVVGTILLLVVILRPPATLARSFEGASRWREALLVIVLGSIVAYLANDTGAAALGFGFGTALAGMLGVSAATVRGKMSR